MCELCMQSPCPPRCGNAYMRPAAVCAGCAGAIYTFDKALYLRDGTALHRDEDCMARYLLRCGANEGPAHEVCH